MGEYADPAKTCSEEASPQESAVGVIALPDEDISITHKVAEGNPKY